MPLVAGDWVGTLNGLAIGPGTPYSISDVQGWEQISAQPLGGNGQMLPHATDQGSWPIQFRVPSRQITLTLSVTNMTSASAFTSAIANLKAATQPTELVTFPLTLTVNGVTLTANVVVEDRAIDTNRDYQWGIGVATIMLRAQNPRLFGSQMSASTALPNSAGGFTFPHTFPMAWASTVTSGKVQLTSSGNSNGPVVVTFTNGVGGPVVNGPAVTQVETGLTLGFSPNFALLPGDFLVVDMAARTCLYNGQASRANFLTSFGWQSLIPGTNTFAFTATSPYSPLPSMTVAATPASL